jgi:Ca2+-binding RTX toxin-like protein
VDEIHSYQSNVSGGYSLLSSVHSTDDAKLAVDDMVAKVASVVAGGNTQTGSAGNDTLKAGLSSTTLTGNGGNDTFNVSAAALTTTTGVANVTVITDFSKGDALQVTAAFLPASAVTQADLSGLATGQTDLQVAAALAAKGNASGDLIWGVYNNNTYVLEDVGTVKTLDVADILVKLTGTLDLSTSTHTVAGTLVFA